MHFSLNLRTFMRYSKEIIHPMRSFLFFLMCLAVVQVWGQSNTNQNNTKQNSNGFIYENKTLEEEKLKVPEPQTFPELKKEVERSGNAAKPSTAKSKAQTESSGVKFSRSRKIASTQLTSRSPSPVQQQEMNDAVNFYKENAPESFEYHYFKYTGGNYDISLYPHLQKAQELKPGNSDVIAQVAAYHIITGDTIQAANELVKLEDMGKIEQEVLSYDQDLLTSVPSGSVLLTHGFDDSYGTFYLNSVMHYSTGVKVISLDFMQSKVYRDSLQKDGFVLPASQTIDVAYFAEFCAKNESRNLFLSMTFPKPYLAPLADKLSIHGLAFAYGAKASGVLEDNEVLWNKILKNGHVYKARTEKGKQLSSNYLPLLFYLRESYEKAGLTDKLSEIDKAIDRIGIQSNKFSKVNTMRGRK